MKAPVNWSTPAQVWLQLGASACILYAIYLYYQKHSFVGIDPSIWLFAGLAAVCTIINIALWYHWKTFDFEIYAALRTPLMVENEQRFAEYVAFKQGQGPLPSQCPMTRAEYITYLEKEFPKALTAYARMGIQLDRSRVFQYIDPFFNFRDTEDRAEYATRYFDFLKLYMTEYPEFDGKK
jgi:hypothetical protein